MIYFYVVLYLFCLIKIKQKLRLGYSYLARFQVFVLFIYFSSMVDYTQYNSGLRCTTQLFDNCINYKMFTKISIVAICHHQSFCSITDVFPQAFIFEWSLTYFFLNNDRLFMHQNRMGSQGSTFVLSFDMQSNCQISLLFTISGIKTISKTLCSLGKFIIQILKC